MELKIEYLSVDDLKPYENNAREHGEEDICCIENSITEFDFCDPIGIAGDNVIVEGHGRLEAAKRLGIDKVPCIRLDHLNEEQQRAYRIAHNLTAEQSSWNMPILEMETADIDISSFGEIKIDIEPIGFNSDVPEKEESTYTETEEQFCTCPSCGLRFVPEYDG